MYTYMYVCRQYALTLLSITYMYVRVLSVCVRARGVKGAGCCIGNPVLINTFLTQFLMSHGGMSRLQEGSSQEVEAACCKRNLLGLQGTRSYLDTGGSLPNALGTIWCMAAPCAAGQAELRCRLLPWQLSPGGTR